MTLFQNRVDRIINRLKRCDALSGVRFVREYTTQRAENPVRGYLAVVGIAKAEREKSYIGGYLSSSSKGESYSATVEIRVYAPNGANGSGLSGLVSEMLRHLEIADKERLISNAWASSIEFDADLNAVFRRLEFEMNFCVSREE